MEMKLTWDRPNEGTVAEYEVKRWKFELKNHQIRQKITISYKYFIKETENNSQINSKPTSNRIAHSLILICSQYSPATYENSI